MPQPINQTIRHFTKKGIEPAAPPDLVNKNESRAIKEAQMKCRK
jgi:hypothetical protein